MAAERRTSAVGCGARRQHESETAASSDKLQRAFDEQLVSVHVGTRLDTVNAGLTDEGGHRFRVITPCRSGGCLTAVAANHVPRRVADDGIEAWCRQWFALGIVEDFRKH